MSILSSVVGICPASTWITLSAIFNKPLFYVEGNHVQVGSDGKVLEGSNIHGGLDLHRKVMRCPIRGNNLLLAGIAGSLEYHGGPYHFSQTSMWLHVFRLIPGLLRNRVLYGRYLDIFVTHALPGASTTNLTCLTGGSRHSAGLTRFSNLATTSMGTSITTIQTRLSRLRWVKRPS